MVCSTDPVSRSIRYTPPWLSPLWAERTTVLTITFGSRSIPAFPARSLRERILHISPGHVGCSSLTARQLNWLVKAGRGPGEEGPDRQSQRQIDGSITA